MIPALILKLKSGISLYGIKDIESEAVAGQDNHNNKFKLIIV